MPSSDNEKGEKRNNRGIELRNQEKYQNIWRKKTLQVPEDIGSGHHQTNKDERSVIVLANYFDTIAYPRIMLKFHW